MITKIRVSDGNYPYLLKNIPDPPEVLYIKGKLPLGKYLAVVGTRQMTAYGELVTRKLVTGLANAGFVIVSGLALGIDGVAHRAAIAAGGKTVAVLGAGVELVYPAQHLGLYNSVLAHGGAIVSEVPGRETVPRARFPARNRIVSGLAQAVLVIEGPLRSGSMITAKLALDQGRDVFAVPGSPATDYLISCGALPIDSGDTIVRALRP